MKCKLIIDLQNKTYIILYISAEWPCEIYDLTLSSLTLTLTLKLMSWPF